ncbi:MAG: hypothetical protein IJ677_06990 [Alphaproteobacteria bacterium]|nr:hypothetical protein [Alphaproteobacteria bacterium]
MPTVITDDVSQPTDDVRDCPNIAQHATDTAKQGKRVQHCLVIFYQTRGIGGEETAEENERRDETHTDTSV